MRRKIIVKVVVCACITAMGISFASCAKPASAVPSVSDPSVSDITEPTSEDITMDTALPTSTESAPSVPVDVTPPPVTGIARPTDTASAVKLYNDAVAKKGTVTGTVSREMLGGKVAVIEITSIAPTAPDAFRLTDAPLEGADLYALDAGNVASTEVKEVGDNYVVTFNLNNAFFDDSSAFGDGGYMYFLNVEAISKTINSIGQSIMNDPTYDFTVKTEKVEISATGGKFVAVINKTTGMISSAEVAFSEDIKVPLSKPITGTAKVQCQGSVKYTIA